jgi:hypothetical protein
MRLLSLVLDYYNVKKTDLWKTCDGDILYLKSFLVVLVIFWEHKISKWFISLPANNNF